ncbi:MAG: hypothetical protein PHU07_07370 [Acidocella sp.]|nr:hypothetical protein [Acidocella sp.]
MRHEKQTLLSEIRELNTILASIPEENVIERVGFEARLKQARAKLEGIQLSVEPEKTRVTFRGAPVFGSHGVAADFGTKASGYFAEAFASIVASMREGLRYMGPIPDKAQNQLAITGVAVGSFGFEFELPNLPSTLFSESGGAEEALETLLNLLEKAAEGSDDEVTEAVHAAHPRAVRKVVDFLDYMEKKGAWCGVEFKQHFFRYSDLDQLRFAKERLSEGSVRHAKKTYRGTFQGSLPRPRTFQFQPVDNDAPIMGRFDASIDPHAINKHWLGRPVSVQLDVVQVGHGRPRFTLMDLSNITAL